MPRSDIFGVGDALRVSFFFFFFFFFFFYVSRVTDALAYFKHKQKRKRERKLCVSFDDDDLLIYVVLHETITVFYAYTRRRGIDALLSRRCVVTRGFSHSR